MTIRKKRDEITSISQTLNYVLAHATKPGSEPHAMIRRIMRTATGFEALKQFSMQAVTELNNFHCCVQSCLHNGMPTSISPNNTNDGWKT
eukprot:3021918-Amphidinium_carterae.2